LPLATQIHPADDFAHQEREVMPQRIKMYSTEWCPDCRMAKTFLQERNISFEEINIEGAADAVEIVIQATRGKPAVPTFDIDGQFATCSPFRRSVLKQALGVES
jgi:mycoredoxin